MPQRTLDIRTERWPLRRPFTISRGTRTEAEVVTVTLREGDCAGRAECVPYARYGESVDSVVATIGKLRAPIEAGLDRDALQHELPPGAARNALDCALWDLEAKIAGEPVWRLAGLPQPGELQSAVTVSIGPPAGMAAEAAAWAGCPLLKVKLGRDDVIASLEAVRAAAPAARIIVDANEAWTLAEVIDRQAALVALGIDLIEQPLPAGGDEGLSSIEHRVPFCADESCHTTADLEALAGRYEFVNIKLDKTGGLTEAIRLRKAALAGGYRLMVGCMVGTSLAMAPAILVAAGAEVVDLDGPVLLSRDREPGVVRPLGRLAPPRAALWG